MKNLETTVTLAPIKKLTKHLKESSMTITRNDIRFVIQSYYQIQEYRLALASQTRSINQSGENAPQHELLDWLFSNMKQLEEEIVKAVDSYTDSLPVGVWLKQILGIGPILAGGLLCYFDIEKAPSVSHFYSYAGLNDNNNPWLGKTEATAIVNKYIFTNKDLTDENILKLANATTRKFEKLVAACTDDKGNRSKEALIKYLSKPPYNIELKLLTWKVGESFVKVSGKPNSLYGRLYKEKKHYYTLKNDNGDFASRAKQILDSKNIGKTTEAYKYYSNGKLPPSHIQAMAKRYAVKIFISHLYDEMYKAAYKKTPARAYVLEHLGHVDVIDPEVPGIVIK